MTRLFHRLTGDRSGSFAIETAFVLPILILMTIGIFEVGRMIARQHELQSAANESEIIILATNQGAETNVADIRNILRNSLNLTGDDIRLTQSYRCNADADLVASPTLCADDEPMSSYINLDVTDTYEPVWTYMGIGQPINFSVQRRVQVS
ncbi:TadE/TadG family type IV pilus assembly protein [Porphyrobacter sp. LM 6]|jgi:Flp pilus assembly protein TadG|uniref:TadE/TadG family type IV pilus assembly protein n=1 Tax=Porphyrobacter sp. LM 6 TaxID=1896196 RepID=UPI00084786D1|nr:TadE family protein [Porphyrobacter sp. LM 6]AOL94896.1 TadE-like protein [Porphyrobacter sp. LM 6]